MSLIATFLSFFMELDANLIVIIQNYGILTYPLLFIIIFLETGIVLTPFLPGDSLIFAAAALASRGFLNIFLLFFLVAFAAILGDTVNFWIGKFIGKKIIDKGYVKSKYISQTEKFYDKYGGKTIIIARFIPIVRTFAPFVAGIGKMDYLKFFSFNVIGGLFWVFLFCFTGYFFGSIPFVKDNFSLVIMAIILISVLPAVIEFLRHKLKKKSSSQ